MNLSEQSRPESMWWNSSHQTMSRSLQQQIHSSWGSFSTCIYLSSSTWCWTVEEWASCARNRAFADTGEEEEKITLNGILHLSLSRIKHLVAKLLIVSGCARRREVHMPPSECCSVKLFMLITIIMCPFEVISLLGNRSQWMACIARQIRSEGIFIKRCTSVLIFQMD